MTAPTSGSADAPQDHLDAYYQTWYLAYAPVIARRGPHWRYDIWEKGVLELVSPLEPYKREEIRRLDHGLPWGGRLDIELYWRIMYAAYSETFRTEELKPVEGERSPVRVAVLGTLLAIERPGDRLHSSQNMGTLSYMDQTLGQIIYKQIIKYAADEVRIRTGCGGPAPKPMPLGLPVKFGGFAALVSGFNGHGRILLGRETEPADSGPEWKLNIPSGRWQAWVMPWMLKPEP